MGLSCACDHDHAPGQTIWSEPTDYQPLATARARRCCSCGTRIAVGQTCCEWPRSKIPEHAVELNIYGKDGEIPRASAWMCESCADLAFSLRELGFCPQPWEDQRALAKDYAAHYGPGADPPGSDR